ncbi:hypothetical protein quinque_001367 [Culex quinquefasciatus]
MVPAESIDEVIVSLLENAPDTVRKRVEKYLTSLVPLVLQMITDLEDDEKWSVLGANLQDLGQTVRAVFITGDGTGHEDGLDETGMGLLDNDEVQNVEWDNNWQFVNLGEQQ